MYRYKNHRHRRNQRKIGSLKVHMPNMTYLKFYDLMRSFDRIKSAMQIVRRTNLKTKMSIQIRKLGVSVDLKN